MTLRKNIEVFKTPIMKSNKYMYQIQARNTVEPEIKRTFEMDPTEPLYS